MLKVFNILLLVSMASMCRALAGWEITTTYSSEVLVVTNETNVVLFGVQVSPYGPNVGLSIIEYDSDGHLLQSTANNNTDLFSVKEVIVEGNDFIILGVAKSRSTDYKHHPLVCRMTKRNVLVWVKKYSEGYGHPDFHLLQTKEGYLIAGALRDYLIKLTMMDKEGNILWDKTYRIADIVKEFIKTENGYFLAALTAHKTSSLLTCINTAMEVQDSLHMASTSIDSMAEADSGSVLLTGNTNGIPFIARINCNCTIEWKTMIDIDEPIRLNSIKQVNNGGYIAAGGYKIIASYVGILIKFYPGAHIRWIKRFSCLEFYYLVETKPDTYYMLTIKGSSIIQVLIKYTVPQYAEGLHCAKYEQCRSCGLGFYWNYTSCVPCSVGCVECLDIDHCINCSSRYAKTEDNRCIPVEEPCNCDLPNLTPECREKCALPVCSSNSSLPFTYKTDNKKVCTCPDEMLSNETHCLPKTDVGCHPLCDICAGEYCLQCKNITGIFVSRTHSIAVKCQCDYGYQFNSTACIPVKRIHNVQSSESLVAIALGIIGGLVAVGSVAFIMYLKYRRDEWMHGENLPDIQTGKEQHTVEVSKEMEVHAITRDDERTGEIMFKRE
eukprot:TRINITY_DN165_c0_g1_i12.p1 TRINITY_DN165_c0_g1~~TRINITY_DN165_c0_g1_i12.p1  ORF type:complete len:640 (+),score=21.09 TRINITY_DN165_c0_g1_i12:98-1921(+)